VPSVGLDDVRIPDIARLLKTTDDYGRDVITRSTREFEASDLRWSGGHTESR
jgi:hypothetical protein